MNNAIQLSNADGLVITYSPETDKRIAGIKNGKLITKTLKGARELAGEARAWGLTEARALGFAVVFWG